ncbi:adventurous gliding motility protein AgmC [Archangium sp.]|uniref:adventurous gliding motility protein AgmC n=1 Tax=Archangium sp. TaxID=1872627 RepID=UPI00286A042A|nr:Ig-like domain-containing protein [Archangium sp.]
MRNPFNKKWLAATLCTLALGSTAALAEPDSFGLGTGRNGDLTVSTTGTNIINSYAPVTGPLAPGDTSLPVGSCLPTPGCSFVAGDLVMVLQTTGVVPEPASGAAGALDISNDPVGRWEFARLASVSGSTMGLTAPLVHSYAANVTQVIKVPEYANVSLTITGARINALAWDGRVGGVIAFLATGTVSNAGQITANATGFRGGQFVDEPTDALGCSGLDEPAPLGAQKGEGIAVTRYGAAQTGRGNVANGAGGGVCLKSGGGGGGNYGAGGMGGRSEGFIDGERPVGGMGGAALVYSPLNRLTPGGGGGAGQGTDSSGVSGGRGGGIIFIRANQLTGTGSIQASGGSGGSSVSDGGSGGGAGGSIHLRFVGTAACSSVSANGGVGGTVNTARVGPGGGGGGGRVLFQAATGGTCNLNLTGAANGNQQDPSATNGTAYGATAGANGIPIVLAGGFVVPPTPEVNAPVAGSFTNNRRPIISGTARANTTVIVYVDGVEVGRTTSLPSGLYSVTPTTDLPEGSRTVQAVTEVEAVQSPRSPPRTFTVDVTPPDTRFTSSPPSRTNSASATFDFIYVGTEPGPVTYQCKLDSEPDFTDCTSPKTYTGLSEEAHVLFVRAVDAAGNVDPTPARHDWTVDLTPPDTTVTAGPPRYTNSRNASLQFTHVGTETGAVTYRCKLETEPTYASCTSPKLYTGLADGTYTFQVRAVDAAGNSDQTPATYVWTVDTAPPTVTIVSGPTGTTRDTSATFDFTSNEAAPSPPGVTYLCKLDTEADFTPCPDPKTYTGLGEGTHRLEVLAEDAAGNRSETPAVRTWTVDTTAPNTVIVSGPTGLTRSTSATFEFSVETPEPGVTYECKLDTEADFSSCTNPRTFSNLAQGPHTLQVRAVDAVGNADATPASRTWTVDTVAPAAPVVSAPASGATVDTLTPAITGTAEAGSTVTVIIDGQVVGTVKADASGNWSYTPTTPLTVGPHEVKTRATDEAGNTSPDSTGRTWTVQEARPTGDISFRGDGFGCSATGGDASLVLMSLGTFLALARRRRR